MPSSAAPSNMASGLVHRAWRGRCWSSPAPDRARRTRSPTRRPPGLTGADPQRILLLTFSRRAAAEMERRVGRILNHVLGAPLRREPPALPLVGHLPQRRRTPAARIRAAHRPARILHHPRPRGLGGSARDSRDTSSALSATESALSDQGHVPRDLLARRQQPRAAARGAGSGVPVVRARGSRS